MSGGLFDYIQNQAPAEPPELPSEPRKRTPLEIAQAEQQDAVEQARAVYKAYQENILKSGTLQSEILKGMYQGESTAVLLLKALEVISCMTEETVTYQVAGAEVQKRLECLENALQGADGTERERILQAIKAHREKLEQLKK